MQRMRCDGWRSHDARTVRTEAARHARRQRHMPMPVAVRKRWAVRYDGCLDVRRRILLATALLFILFCVVAVRPYGWLGSPNGGETVSWWGGYPAGGFELWGSPGFF